MKCTTDLFNPSFLNSRSLVPYHFESSKVSELNPKMDNISNEPQVRRLKSLKRKTISTPILIDEIKLENVVGVTVINNASIAKSSSGR